MKRAEAEAGIAAIKAFAKGRMFFGGGEVLFHWRESEPPDSIAHQDWRNKWGVLLVKAATYKWIVPAGRDYYPVEPQSHTNNLTRWRSNLFVGPPRKRIPDEHLVRLLEDVRAGEVSVEDAVEKAHAIGLLGHL